MATPLNVSHKSSNSQVFRLMLYQRAVHPELVDLQGRRQHRQDNYEVEYWILPCGHVARFQVGDQLLTEAVLERGDHLPENGLVYALPCLGEKEYEHEPTGRIGYVTTIQTETLNENLYMATYREMSDFAKEVGALCHTWTATDGAPCLSLVDVQRYRKEFHVQSYHLAGATGLVLRTQSIFEVLED